MKFRLDAPHYLWDQLFDPGVEIGDDTPYPIPDGFAPSATMTPLDKEAENLVSETAKSKQNWGRPEDNIPLRGDMHPIVGQTINRPNQPVIPPPLEHLTNPSDMKPGEAARPNPLLEDALQKERDRLAAVRDEQMAKDANEAADKRAAEAPKPQGVTADKPKGATVSSTPRPPGQGPEPKPVAAPGQGQPKPPAPPSNQVPRNTAGLSPESPDGKFQEPRK